MRMWMINPVILCRKHLLGEHSEIHKHKHNFEKGHSMDGRLYPKTCIEPASMQSRHDKLAAEMLRRGYKHQSPFVAPDISHYPQYVREARVVKDIALDDLLDRCEQCKNRYDKYVRKLVVHP